MTRYTRRTDLKVLAIALCLLSACSRESSDNTSPVPIEEVRLILPSETLEIVRPSIEAFNAARLLITGSGTVVRLSAVTADGVAATQVVSDSALNHKTTVWLSSNSALLELARSRLSQEKQLEEKHSQEKYSMDGCRAVASTVMGAAFISSNAFAVEQDGGSALYGQFILDSTERDLARTPMILAGLPSSSVSGVSTLIMSGATVLKSKVESLSPTSSTESEQALSPSQRRISRYFASDRAMLEWMALRQEGRPLVAITTRQQVTAHNLVVPNTSLQFLPAVLPELRLNYQLCALQSKTTSTAAREAQQLIITFLTNSERLAPFKQLGFDEPLALNNEGAQPAVQAVERLLAPWHSIKKPSTVTFVIDSSSRLTRALSETIKRELSQFILADGARRDTFALVSSSTRPELLSAPTADLGAFKDAILEIRGSGASAIRDAIIMAIDLYAEASPEQNRGAIIVLTNGPDSASSATTTALKGRALSCMNRKGVALYVIGVSNSSETPSNTPSDIAQLTQEIGGTFIATTVGELPAALHGVFREVE